GAGRRRQDSALRRHRPVDPRDRRRARPAHRGAARTARCARARGGARAFRDAALDRRASSRKALALGLGARYRHRMKLLALTRMALAVLAALLPPGAAFAGDAALFAMTP